MPTPDPKVPICPHCSYDLTAHCPTEQADPNENAKVICPECGNTTTSYLAKSAPIPNKHPVLTTLLALFVIASLSWCCCAGIWQGFIVDLLNLR